MYRSTTEDVSFTVFNKSTQKYVEDAHYYDGIDRYTSELMEARMMDEYDADAFLKRCKNSDLIKIKVKECTYREHVSI